MKPELIIAKIEAYINSLPQDEKEHYNGVMTISRSKKESASSLNKALNSPLINLAEIVEAMEKELFESTIKQSKGNSTLNRIKAINKYLSKCNNDKFKKAFIHEDNFCFLNGFTAFILNEKLDGIEIQGNTIDIESFFPKSYDLKEFEVNIAEVKTALKLHKASESGKKAKDKTKCYYEVFEHWYNAEFIIDCYDILGDNIKFFQTNNVLAPAVLENENGKAILLPVRKAEVDKAR